MMVSVIVPVYHMLETLLRAGMEFLSRQTQNDVRWRICAAPPALPDFAPPVSRRACSQGMGRIY